jgi:tripartite-type tricarboxylate transporter receptor subunit TctC
MAARVLVLALLALLSLARIAAAETYPSHPVTFVVPFPAHHR